jgi:hypothetical protein
MAAIITLGVALAIAPTAHATFHLMSIREVYPGSVAHPESGYVELQMYAAGQDLVGGHALTIYNAGGTLIGTFTFPSSVPNSANQQTILIGDSGVQEAFGVAPDLTNAGFEVQSGGGAACWAGTIDCVSWGAFAGSTASPSGSPADAAGIPNGMALRRTIEPGCPTLLEGADDTNGSATDFLDATPIPRNNSSSITETACTGPASTIDSKPANPTKSTSASFTYHSTPAGGSFECKLDGGFFESCSMSGIEYAGPLSDGNHTFQVRAKDVSETLGTPASYTWRVDTIVPTATIDSHPADPSPGTSAAFTYHSSESGSSFECSLAAGAAADSFSACPSSSKTYMGLADGDYTFKVRATDAAKNQGAATAFEWEVDSSLADTTPPQTSILTKPPDPSASATAAFTYESNEPGSTFECGLDGAAFASCPAAGITYTGLANGPHTFLVRASDTSENVDPTPAGYSFAVQVSAPPSPATLDPPPVFIATPTFAQPDTMIISGPRRTTRDRTPTVRFSSSAAGALFQCSVDRGRFRSCRSPFTTESLRPGRHRILVRAISGGTADPTPATRAFSVIGGPHRARHQRAHRTHRQNRRRRDQAWHRA